jgi:hypothetical protein
MFTFGMFSGVWSIVADVSEHCVCSILKQNTRQAEERISITGRCPPATFYHPSRLQFLLYTHPLLSVVFLFLVHPISFSLLVIDPPQLPNHFSSFLCTLSPIFIHHALFSFGRR